MLFSFASRFIFLIVIPKSDWINLKFRSSSWGVNSYLVVYFLNLCLARKMQLSGSESTGSQCRQGVPSSTLSCWQLHCQRQKFIASKEDEHISPVDPSHPGWESLVGTLQPRPTAFRASLWALCSSLGQAPCFERRMSVAGKWSASDRGQSSKNGKSR